VVVLVLLGIASGNASAIDYNWNNAAGGNWNVNTNWSPVGPPGASDNATLGTLSGAYTVQLTDPRSINNLTISSANATLAQSGNLSVASTGAFNMTAGTFGLSAGALDVVGSLDFSPGTTFNWTGGSIGSSSNGPMTLEGITAVTSSTGKTITGSTLQNTGTFRWSAGTISAGTANAGFTNASGGVIDFRNDGTPFAANTATLVNRGTIVKSAGEISSTTIGWAVDFRGGGTVDAQIGVLNFANGGFLRGGTTTFTNTGNQGGGTVNLTGGTFTVPNNAVFNAASANGVTLNWAGGTLQGDSASGTIAGVINVTGTVVVAGTTLTTAGMLNWQSGGLVQAAANGVVLTNTGTINFQADGTAFYLGSATLVNQGTLVKSAGPGTTGTAIGWAVISSGNINGNVGILNFASGLTNTGTVMVANGASITGSITSNSGGVVRSAPASLATDVATCGGPLTFNTGSTLAPGGVGATGALTVSGNLTLNSGSTLNINLNGTTAGTGFDRIRVGTGSTTALGGATLTGSTGPNFNPTSSDQLFILVNDNTNAISGTFNGLAQDGAGTLGGWNFKISYTGDFVGNKLSGGNDIVLYAFTPVPEPTGILGLTTLVGLAAARLRRHRRTRYEAAAPVTDPLPLQEFTRR
jgi:hypothetical protein